MAVTISSIAQSGLSLCCFVLGFETSVSVSRRRARKFAIFGFLLFRTFMDNSLETRRFVKPGSCEIRFVAIKLRERNLTT